MTVYHVTDYNHKIITTFKAIVPSIMALSDGKVTGVLPVTRRTHRDDVIAWINAQTSSD